MESTGGVLKEGFIMLQTALLIHILFLFFVPLDIDFSNLMLPVVEFPDLTFFLVTVQSKIILLHQLRLSVLFSDEGFNKSDFLVEEDEVSRFVIFEGSDLSYQLLKLVVQSLLLKHNIRTRLIAEVLFFTCLN